ncbi:MAG TPA: response regulator transcription factor [Roseiflexaceae bacterium]|nr:response regulator transcription factor [Roseiflexaceae bacterium]
MLRPFRLLVVENEPAHTSSLAAFLQAEGYRVTHSSNGVGSLNLVRRTQPDLIILDADLPGIDGITLAGAIRKQASTPIILLTDGADELQQVIGLDRGADLCMVKPVSLAELRARLRALLRRAERDKAPRAQALTIGELRIDPSMRRAWLGGQELQLTPKEFELLAYLMRNRGLVLPREQLLRDVWGGRVPARSQTLDVHIRWLRQKVEPNPEQPIYIQTVRMIGYRFEGP